MASELREIGRLLKHLIKQQVKRNAKEHEAREPPTLPAIHAELKLPVQIAEAYSATQSQQGEIDRKRLDIERGQLELSSKNRLIERQRLWLEWLTLLGVVATVVFTFLTLGQMQRQTAAMDNTLGEAKSAREDSTKASRLDQRAWVVAKMVTGSRPLLGDAPSLTADSPAVMGILLSNDGKTPARDVKGMVDVRILARQTTFYPRYRDIKDRPTLDNVSLAPSSYMVLMAPPSQEIITKQMHEDLRVGRLVLYIFGHYTYEDTFGTGHYTKFCMYAVPGLSGMASCHTYNEVD
ncbi:MAG: hypothetical protein WD696_23020 [Bryobacteraceae bacterium]